MGSRIIWWPPDWAYEGAPEPLDRRGPRKSEKRRTGNSGYEEGPKAACQRGVLSAKRNRKGVGGDCMSRETGMAAPLGGSAVLGGCLGTATLHTKTWMLPYEFLA